MKGEGAKGHSTCLPGLGKVIKALNWAGIPSLEASVLICPENKILLPGLGVVVSSHLWEGSGAPTVSQNLSSSPLHHGGLFIPVPEGILGGFYCGNQLFPEPLTFPGATHGTQLLKVILLSQCSPPSLLSSL